MAPHRDRHDEGAETEVSAPFALVDANGADPFARTDEPGYSITLWPHRSLSPEGLKVVLCIVGFGLLIPLIPFIGTPVAWGLIPFLVMAMLAVYAAFRRSYRDGRLHEVLRLWPDLVTVERVDPKGGRKRWHANPFWVEVAIQKDAKLENYLTLRGNGRTIELGAFLSPEEREELYQELQAMLKAPPTRI
ncbi:DUF2244 domain-containing protein [Algicella marina]|uniref:DUF2244 domain-containing protein n=1 Tax=Algicella marina TaxID=2683284 RepID=A0A6P1T019_9RHOB|nr:DUF2244 domain-containing protein [Algicella marina]QHQ35061.1 DUF2244 domain-containing protein [Algicella marina]